MSATGGGSSEKKGRRGPRGVYREPRPGDDITIEQLRVFAEIFRLQTKGITAEDRAKKLQIPEGTIRTRIQELQNSLCVPIVDVHGAVKDELTRAAIPWELYAKGRLTTVGMAFAEHADAIVKLWDAALSDKRLARRHATIYAVGTIAALLLPGFLKLYKDQGGKLDQTRLLIEEAETLEIIDAVRSRRAAIGLAPDVGVPMSVSKYEKPLCTVARCLIYRDGHRFGIPGYKNGEAIKLDQLVDQVVFILTPSASTAFQMEAELPVMGEKGSRILVSQVDWMYHYVSQGLGVGVAFDKRLTLEPYRDVIKTAPIVDYMPGKELEAFGTRTFCLYFRNDYKEFSSAPEQELLERLKQEADNGGIIPMEIAEWQNKPNTPGKART